MRSPGQPGVNEYREVRRQFWRRIAEGLSSEEAAAACGVSQPVGGRWFRQGGGMSPLSLAPLSGRYLSFAEREEISLLKAQGKVCGRSAGRLAVTRQRYEGARAQSRDLGVHLGWQRVARVHPRSPDCRCRSPGAHPEHTYPGLRPADARGDPHWRRFTRVGIRWRAHTSHIIEDQRRVGG